jgi:hypothetical protein
VAKNSSACCTISTLFVASITPTTSIRQHTSAHVSTRQHTSAHVRAAAPHRCPLRAYSVYLLYSYKEQQHLIAVRCEHTQFTCFTRTKSSSTSSLSVASITCVSIRQHTSAYVSIRQHLIAVGCEHHPPHPIPPTITRYYFDDMLEVGGRGYAERPRCRHRCVQARVPPTHLHS